MGGGSRRGTNSTAPLSASCRGAMTGFESRGTANDAATTCDDDTKPTGQADETHHTKDLAKI